MQEKLIDLLKKTISFYTKKGINKSQVEAIFSKVLNLDRLKLYMNHDRLITEDEQLKLKQEFKNIGIVSDLKEDTIRDLLEKSIKYMEKYNVEEAKLKAEIIFSNVLNIDRMYLFMSYNNDISEGNKEKIRNYIKKVAIDKLPLSYIFNKQIFYGYEFYVDNSVLIPRMDTEILVEEVLKKVKYKDKILDIGTGSGAIGISVALEKKNEDLKILCTDISEKAINIAKINKKNHNLNNIKIIKSDLFENIEFKEFDIIVSNPPYIDLYEEVELMSEDTKHEPEIALYASDEGYYFYNEITKNSVNHLKKDGYLFFEIGFNQASRVKEILEYYNFYDITIIKDLAKNDRVVYARYKGKNES